MSSSLHQVSFVSEFSSETFSFLGKYSKRAVLVDENTLLHCYPLIQNLIGEHHIIQIKSGEEQKNIATCQHIWEQLTNFALDRKSILINLGGGVIGDMGGFCAATYKRGIDFIQVPTTLLSQVDASVGGKLGIDFMGYKNHIGVFQIPRLVIICPLFLATLPVQELRSGYAEVIKHALIADATHWKYLLQHTPDMLDWSTVIQHSVRIKANVVEQDPTEKSLRKILNFGHTIGHAIESHYLPTSRKLLHGEAIAIGMIAEAYLSMKRNRISEAELQQITGYILKIFGKIFISQNDFEGFKSNILHDKKNEGSQILCALLAKIGECTYDDAVTWQEVCESLEYYNGLAFQT